MKVAQIKHNASKDLQSIYDTDERTLDFKELQLVLDMPSQVCYRLFKATNESVGEVAHLQTLLINSLLDDAYIGFTKCGSHSHLSWYNDCEGDEWLTREQVMELIVKSIKLDELQKEIPELSTYGPSGYKRRMTCHQFKTWRAASRSLEDLKVTMGYQLPESVLRMRRRQDNAKYIAEEKRNERSNQQ